MGIIETRGDESAAIQEIYQETQFFYFLDSTIASGLMKVAGNALQQLALPLSDTIPLS